MSRSRRHFYLRLIGVSLIALASVSLLTGASAQKGGDVQPATRLFGIRAGLHGKTTLEDDHFTYAVKPGTKVVDSVEILNFRDQALDVRIYPADMLTAKGGGLAPAQASAPRKTVGRWIGMEYGDVSVAANDTSKIPFSISVPTGVVPGEYVGAVVAALKGAPNASGIAVETRAALMVRVRVPGKTDLGVDVRELRSTDVEGGRRFDVVIRNTGNVLFTTNGGVRLRRGGKTIGTVALEPAGIYIIPGGEAEFRATWKDVPAFGRVKAEAIANVALNDRPAGEFRSRPLWMSLLPLRWLAGGILLGGAALLGRRLTRARRRARKQVREVARQIVAERSAPETTAPRT